MESILAALISGLATIVAALISRQGSRPKSSAASAEIEQSNVINKNVTASVSKSNTNWWTTAMGLFTLFVVCAGFFVHHDLPSMIGLFGIPVVVILLALTKPTKPWTAAAFVFGVSTIAFLTEFAVKISQGQSIALSSNDRWLPFWLLFIAAIYAFLGAIICWWKRKKLMKA